MMTRRLLASASAACLVIAIACFGLAWQYAGHRHLVPFAAPPATGQLSVGLLNHEARESRSPGRSRPVRVDIPAVGLSARVVPVGLTHAGQMEMPRPSTAGWYRLGPIPGARGPAVLVGHVDSDTGPAAFYRLSGVRRGETFWVVRADGSQSRFLITRITVVAKTDFPSAAVFAPTRRADIRLITCTGPFDSEAGYLDSLIVWGHLVRV